MGTSISGFYKVSVWSSLCCCLPLYIAADSHFIVVSARVFAASVPSLSANYGAVWAVDGAGVLEKKACLHRFFCLSFKVFRVAH
mmetsp:Transcript_45528/g.103909  ORF Transcript_45528/g.103909 Transcript_45528/m.103909 type:complete len:84 (+) Transcript_45528:897-1148(+)